MVAVVEIDLPALAGRARAGDSVALEHLLAGLRPEVVRVTRLVVGPGYVSAEDAAQDALIDIANGLSALREPAAVRSWALRIASRRALRVARRQRLKERLFPPFAKAASDAATVDPPTWRTAALKESFNALPPRLRAIAVLRLYADLSEADTAKVLDCAEGTVKSGLNEARKRLTAALRAQGVTTSAQSHGGDTVD